MLKVTEIAFCCYAVTDIPRMRKFNKGGSRESATRREGQWIESGFSSYALTTGCWPGMSVVPDGDDFRSRQQHGLHPQAEGWASLILPNVR